MSTQMLIEGIGYLGSILVVVSMLMTSVVRLRVINLAGSLIFAVYALIIRSYPTALMNIFLVGINLYNLYRLRRSDPQYRFVDHVQGSPYLTEVLNHYAEDIRKYFPSFRAEEASFDDACLVTCDLSPAGIFLGKRTGEDEIDILLDYSIPAYRDLSLGKSLFAHLKETGVRRLTMSGPDSKHLDYLQKMGFVKENDRYIKEL